MNKHTSRMLAGLMAGALLTLQPARGNAPVDQDTSHVRQLFEAELAHALHAERRLQAVFSQWADRTRDDRVKDLLQRQAAQAETHRDQLQQACMLLGRSAEETPAKEFEGLLDDAESAARNNRDRAELDLVLLLGALRAQQYMITTCTALLGMAQRAGMTDVAELFELVREETEMAHGEGWNLYRARTAQLVQKPQE